MQVGPSSFMAITDGPVPEQRSVPSERRQGPRCFRYAVTMILRFLPLIAGLIPIFTVFTCYWIAVHTAGVPSCNPFIDGCTSVSATGRHPPASYLFKATMLPQSILLAAYWLFSVAWLRALDAAAGVQRRSGTAIGIIGVTGALFLILYVTFLGTEQPFYEFMRRYGVYLYFALNVIAQLLLAYKVLPHARHLADTRLLLLTKLQLLLTWVPFLLGILNLILKAVLEQSRPAENRIEWVFAILMQVYFVISYFSWRETQFSASFTAGVQQR